MDNVAVVVHVQQVQALANYLSERPYNEVREFFEAIPKWPGITQEQVDVLFPQPKEEAPE